MPMGGDEDDADQIESRPEKAGSKPAPDESKEGSGKQPTIGGRWDEAADTSHCPREGAAADGGCPRG